MIEYAVNPVTSSELLRLITAETAWHYAIINEGLKLEELTQEARHRYEHPPLWPNVGKTSSEYLSALVEYRHKVIETTYSYGNPPHIPCLAGCIANWNGVSPPLYWFVTRLEDDFIPLTPDSSLIAVDTQEALLNAYTAFDAYMPDVIVRNSQLQHLRARIKLAYVQRCIKDSCYEEDKGIFIPDPQDGRPIEVIKSVDSVLKIKVHSFKVGDLKGVLK